MPRRLGRLLQRKDFLRVAGGKRKWVAPGLILQALPAPEDALVGSKGAGPEAEQRRVGFTASKKVGNAVQRNRAKRRLRAAARQVMAAHAAPAHDYVVIARNETPDRPYTSLVAELELALKRLGVWRKVE
jgi:ribonuclease P protein component